jgi:hypothetical protein
MAAVSQGKKENHNTTWVPVCGYTVYVWRAALGASQMSEESKDKKAKQKKGSGWLESADLEDP